MSERDLLLEQLDAVISDTKTWIDGALHKLGWSKDYLFQKDTELVACPVNPGHRMPRKSLEKHMQYCPLLSKGYKIEELKSEQDVDFCYEKSNTVIKVTISETEFQDVMRRATPSGIGGAAVPEMPLTIDRTNKILTPVQRLALYDYVIEKAKSIRPKAIISAEDLMTLDQDKKEDDSTPKSRLELMAMQRDMKRRRQSYRAKNVHITKKNYTEIMRDVINNQMEAWVAVTTEHEKDKQRDQEDKQRDQEDERKNDYPEMSPHRNRESHSDKYEHRRSRDRSLYRDRFERYGDRENKQAKDGSARSRDRERSQASYCDSSFSKTHDREDVSRERSSHRKKKNHKSRSRSPSKDSRYSSGSESSSARKHKKHKKHKKDVKKKK